jgi:hypothetical protein
MTRRPTPEPLLRESIRAPLEEVRSFVRSFTGLYSDENLLLEVLSRCDAALATASSSPALEELRATVELRCRHLPHVSDRFTDRDPVRIAAARVHAIAAVDQLQDAVMAFHKAASAEQPRSLLRRPSQ